MFHLSKSSARPSLRWPLWLLIYPVICEDAAKLSTGMFPPKQMLGPGC